MMRRNETILVYAVTGLLFVILFVAVVFGNEGQAAVPPADLEVAGAKEPIEPRVQEPSIDDPGKELEKLLNLDQGLGGAKPPKGGKEVKIAQGAEAEQPAANDPTARLVAQLETDSVAPSTAEEQPATKPAAPALDMGSRIGEFREVTVKPGDTFSLLVQRYTGSLEQMELCEVLNEDVDKNNLRAGRTLILPWVDDAELAKMSTERMVTSNKIDQRELTGKTYELKAGDSLWKIATRHTDNKGDAANFVKRIMELNPDLEPERLQVGQKIALP